jgi:hypothetical protein
VAVLLSGLGLAPRPMLGGSRLEMANAVLLLERGSAEPGLPWGRIVSIDVHDEQVDGSARPRLHAVGWATIDREARSREQPGATELPPDEALGAAVRLAQPVAGVRVALLEPTTEGRLVAALVRFGEGPVALYLTGVEHELGGRTQRTPGPFGNERLIPGGPPPGPFVILVDAGGPATIDR